MGILDRFIGRSTPPPQSVVSACTTEQLTHPERTVYEQLLGIYRCRALLPQLHDRCFPLIVGPSGAGKTTTVRTAVDQIRAIHGREHPGGVVSYLELNATAWIPSGAEEPTTLRLLFDAMSALRSSHHGLLVIFLDELDKLVNTSRENHNAPWFRSAMQEIQAVVGRSAGVLLRYRRRWPYLPSLCRVDVDAVLRNAFLIGAGAFQEAYRKRGSGFNSAAMQPARSMDHLLLETHTRKCLFNGDDFQLFSRCQWIMLKPPSADDLRRAASVMIDGPLRPHLENRLGTFVERASSTQAPFRTMESMIMMECLRILREQPLTSMSCGVPGDAGVVNAQ